MIRRVAIKNFRKFHQLDFNLRERGLIAGPNNSGKTALLQALATCAELGDTWLEHSGDLARRTDGNFQHVKIDITSFRTLALSSFDELWHNQKTWKPISIRVTSKDWDVGFGLHYQDAKTAEVGPLADLDEEQLEIYKENPLRALYIPSLSGLDVHEPEYGDRVLTTRLAHGKGGMVLRNMIQVVSRDSAKWSKLQNAIKSFFGFELSRPSGVDPIMVRYRHSTQDHWYDLINGAAGFLQTVLVQSAILHSDAKLLLIDEPDAHLHALLKEKMYRLIRQHCFDFNCQALIATHSGRLIEEAAREKRLFLVTVEGLNPVRPKEAKDLLKIPSEQIVFAETRQWVLYLEGKSDLDILREWAGVLKHPIFQHLENAFWVPTAEEKGRNFAQAHCRALRTQVPSLRALEVRDRNGNNGEQWPNLIPGKLRIKEGHKINEMKVVFWSRYETENYLIHPQMLSRFALKSSGREGEKKATAHMKKHLPGVLLTTPFEASINDREKGKRIIADVLTAAGVELGKSEYYRLAGAMLPEEVHPDVVAMLDIIKDQLVDQDIKIAR